MAPRRPPAPPVVPQLPSLVFNQSLKGCTNTEYLKRLKALHHELSLIDQDNVLVSSLDKVAKELISHSLLLHKEKGVKAFLGCCLVDILRLYAPDAPYTPGEIKDLFQFLFRQLRHLTVPSEPHFEQYFYMIESLSNVKSIVCICDMEDSEELMETIFKQCFDVINSNSPKNVQMCTSDLLIQLLEEIPTIPPTIIDILLAQFLPKNVKQKPAAYQLAIAVCSSSSDKLQRFVCQYFAEVIMTSVDEVGSDSDGDDDPRKGKKGGKSGSNELPPALITAHGLIRQINCSVPSLLTNVIPQIEEELTAEKPEYRKLATEVLGAMLGEEIGQGDLAHNYPGTWKEWLKRCKDKNPGVRIAMAQSVCKIWQQHPECGADIEKIMGNLLLDPDDKVRLAACSVFEDITYETASHHVTKELLVAFGERCKDRKLTVRQTTFRALGRLYDLAFTDIENREPHAISQFAWIPTTIFESLVYGAGDATIQLSIRSLVDSTTLQYLLPLPKADGEETAWVDRLLTLAIHTEEGAMANLLNCTRLTDRRPSPFEAFIDACERNNGDVIDGDRDRVKGFLKMTSKAVASRLSDPNKALSDLDKFAKANERQLYKMLRTLMNPQTDLSLQIKTYKELLPRLERISPAIVDTFVSFVRNSSFLIVNLSSIPTLLKRIQSPSGQDGELLARKSVQILEYVTSKCPALYKKSAAELTKALSDGNPSQLVQVALHALSKLSKSDNAMVVSKALSERAKHFAQEGTPSQAKYAATILALDSARPGTADDIVEHLANALPDASDSDLVAHLSALSRLARHGRDAFDNKSEDITIFALETLNRGTLPGEIPDDVDEGEDPITWVEDDDMEDLTRARLLAIKILTNRCLAYAETDSATQVSVPVFELLWPLVSQGEGESQYSAPVESRLRLAAALAILKLATAPAYNDAIAKRFSILARTVQNEVFEVRHGFVSRLLQYLRVERIKSPRYNMILFLVAHDPDTTLKQQVQYSIISRAQKMSAQDRQATVEHAFVRLLHLLAHHPDFPEDVDEVVELALMAKYIEWYLQCLASSYNVPYLYHLALKVKTVRDADSADFDKKLYILSDLAQHLIKTLAKKETWAIPTHAGSTKMPADIFKSLPTPAVAASIIKRSYIPAETLEKLDKELAKTATKAPKPRAAPREAKPKRDPDAPRQKRKSVASGSTPVKRAKKDVWKQGSDEDEDELSDFDSADSGADEKKPVAAASVKNGKSTRGGLRARNSNENEASPKAKANGNGSAKKKKVQANGSAKREKASEKGQTRGVIRGLNAPRPIKKIEIVQDSDVEDSDGADDVEMSE